MRNLRVASLPARRALGAHLVRGCPCAPTSPTRPIAWLSLDSMLMAPRSCSRPRRIRLGRESAFGERDVLRMLFVHMVADHQQSICSSSVLSGTPRRIRRLAQFRFPQTLVESGAYRQPLPRWIR